MAYEYVRTQNIDISGQSGYMTSLGRAISYTYRFVFDEKYDASENKTRLFLKKLQVMADINDRVNIFGAVYLNGVWKGSSPWEEITTVQGSFATYWEYGGDRYVEVSHDSSGNAPAVTLGFGQAEEQPTWIGSNFGFQPNEGPGVIVGFSTGTTRTIGIMPHGKGSTIASCTSPVNTQANLTLSVERSSPAYYHLAVFSCGGTQLYLSEPFASSLRFAVPRTWFDSFPSSVSLPVTVSVQTYTSSACTTAVGSPATRTITVKADADMKPSVASGWASAAYYNTGTAAASIPRYVKGYSKAQVTFDASKITMANNATIASYSITCQGVTGSTSPYRTPTLTSSGSVSIICKVTDSRGRSASETLTITVYNYQKPSLSEISVFRCNSGGGADDEGTYCSIKAKRTYYTLGGSNSCTLSCAIKQAGGSYGSETTLQSNTAKILSGISTDTSYTVRITATDLLGNSAVYYASISSQMWAMKFRPTGDGVAFGKTAETSNAVEIPADWDFLKGGVPMQAAATYVSDLNVNPEWSGQLVLYRWNANTLNTPYKEGLSDNYAYGMAIVYASYTTGNCAQFAMCAGSGSVFYRQQRGGTWSSWEALARKSEIPTVRSGTVAASVGSNTVKTTSVTFPTPFSSAPSVSVNYAGSITAAEMAKISYSVRNVTATGFDLLVGYDGTTSYGSMSFRWQAIGT